MKTQISKDGLLIIEVSNELEEYAVKQYIQETSIYHGVEKDDISISIKRTDQYVNELGEENER